MAARTIMLNYRLAHFVLVPCVVLFTNLNLESTRRKFSADVTNVLLQRSLPAQPQATLTESCVRYVSQKSQKKRVMASLLSARLQTEHWRIRSP